MNELSRLAVVRAASVAGGDERCWEFGGIFTFGEQSSVHKKYLVELRILGHLSEIRCTGDILFDSDISLSDECRYKRMSVQTQNKADFPWQHVAHPWYRKSSRTTHFSTLRVATTRSASLLRGGSSSVLPLPPSLASAFSFPFHAAVVPLAKSLVLRACVLLLTPAAALQRRRPTHAAGGAGGYRC